jgi:localization factor PodJL
MTNYGPWSVKGIDQRAREAARDAAREEGLTLGDYINRMLLEETGGDAPAIRDDEAPRYPRSVDERQPAPASPQDSGVTELFSRLESVETRSSLALSGIDRSIIDLTRRLDEVQKSSGGLNANVEGVINDLRSTHDALRDKVRALEENKNSPGNLDALRSLERALGKLASHVHDQSSRQKDEAAAVRGRVETGFEDLNERLTRVDGQIESRLDDAAERLARKVEQAELRTEGATRHLSSRFTELENNVTGKLGRVDGFAERVNGVESDVANIASTTDTQLGEMRERIRGAEAATNSSIGEIEKTFSSLQSEVTGKLGEIDTFSARFDTVEERISGVSGLTETQLGALRERITDAETATNSSVDRIEKTFSSLQSEVTGKLEEVDAFSARVDTVEERISNAADLTETQLGALRERITDAETAANSSVDRIEKTFSSLQSDVSGKLEEVDAFSARVDTVEERISSAADLTETQLGALRERITDAETATNSSVDRIEKTFNSLQSDVSGKLEEVDAISTRVDTVEERILSASNLTETQLGQMREQMAAAEATTNSSVEEIEKSFSSLRSDVSGKLVEFDAFSARVDTVEERVSSASDLTETQLDEMRERLGRAEAATNTAMESVEKTFDSLNDRIDALADQVVPEVAKALREQFETRFDGLTGELRTSIESSREALASEIEQVASRAIGSEEFAALGQSVHDLQESVRAGQSDIDRRLQESQEKLTEKMADLEKQAVTTEEATAVRSTLSALRERLTHSETASGQTLAQLTEQIGQVSQGLSRRIEKVEEEDATREVADLRTQLDHLSADVARQLGGANTQAKEVIGKVTADVEKMARRFDTRIDESEKRSATAIEQVGEQVSGIAQRLQARQDRSFRELEEHLDADRTQQQKRLSDALNGMSDRIEQMQEQSDTSISPVQKAIASLASRLELMEDPDAAARSERADEAADTPVETTEAIEAERQSPGRRKSRDDEFEAGLPFLEGFDDDGVPLADMEGAFEYETDLPEESDDNAFSSLSDWDDREDDWNSGGHEVRDSDVFTEDRPSADDSWGLTDEPAESPSPPQLGGGNNDYLSLARKAALQASETHPAKAKKTVRVAKSRKAPVSLVQPARQVLTRMPLVAAVSVVALATVAAGTIFSLRGAENDNVPPVAQPGDAISLAAVETGRAHNGATGRQNLSVDEPAAQPSETVNTVQTPADDAIRQQGAAQDRDEAAAAGTEPPAIDRQSADAGPSVQAQLAGLREIPATPTLQSAVADGNPVAQFLLGQQQLEAGDYTSGPSLVRQSAEQGQAEAQYRLAKLHERGLGVPRDLEMARQWTERAARGGNVKAMHDLAVYYAEGEGGQQTYQGAAEWFGKAADYGLTDSQYNLAVLYEAGLGLSEDPGQALYWYAIAAESGDTGAPTKVDELKPRVPADSAVSLLQEAALWQPKPREPQANGVFADQAWQGDTSDQIAAVQATLAALGYEPGPADGMMGSGTIAAINAYQSEKSLEETGEITPALIEALNSDIRAAKA